MQARVIESRMAEPEPRDGKGRGRKLLGSATASAGVALILAAMFVFNTPDSIGPSYVLGMLIIPIGVAIALYPVGEDPMRCPYCGSINPTGSRSCGSCGREPFIILAMSGESVATISRRGYMARLGLSFAGTAPAYLFFLMVDLAVVAAFMLFLQLMVVFGSLRMGRSFVKEKKGV